MTGKQPRGKKLASKMREEQPTRDPAVQCENCEQWVSPGEGHLCRRDKKSGF